MNIREFDAANMAGAVAHVAAARVCALLQDHAEELAHNWFVDVAEISPEQVETYVEEMAEFICARNISSGETVWRQTMALGYDTIKAGQFAELPVPMQMAFNLFTQTVQSLSAAIVLLQKAEEEADKQQEDVPLPRYEDSIEADGEPGPGDEVDWADGVRKNEAKQAKGKKPAPKPKQAKKPAKKQEPLSAGESLVKGPQNKGGRPSATKAKKVQSGKPAAKPS